MDHHYSHYAPWGSASSFLLGRPGAGGGFVLGDVRPPRESVLIGWWRTGSVMKVLPFLTPDRKLGPQTQVVSPSDVERTSWWASEEYASGPVSLTFHTPFGPVPEPSGLGHRDLKRLLCPAIIAELSLDNEASDLELSVVFGLTGVSRALSSGSRTLMGVARGGSWGVAIDAEAGGVREHLALDLTESLANAGRGPDGFNRLGKEGGVVVTVAPRTRRTLRLALATWQEGTVTSGIEAQLYYTTCFHNLDDVLEFALEHADETVRLARERNAELEASRLNADRQFLLGHATRSYLANTQLLLTRDGDTIFVISEGEYQMMNTLDLTVDQAFWELKYHPWTVKNELETALNRGSYHDRYGRSFSHDLGVSQVFSPPGISSYEVPDVAGCFGYMTFEELLNWILTSGLYVTATGDVSWLVRQAAVIEDVWQSLRARDSDGDGLMDLDSDRCGDGAEITTYDSLDSSLGQSRSNLYVGVKTWAALLTLGRFFVQLGRTGRASEAEAVAGLAAKSLLTHFSAADGLFPAVFEPGNQSRILPAVEALIYPWFRGDLDAVREDGRFGELIRALKTHVSRILKPGICIDAQSGGWKLSSTSRNTWMSKIFLNQFVVRSILGMRFPEEEQWDRVHASWMKGGCGGFAATDQVDSATGADLGSRLYPRLVTSVLWL